MGTTDDLREVIRAEFAQLVPADPELTGRLEQYALDAVAGLDPEAAAGVAVAVVAGTHEIVAATPLEFGPTVGDLSARQLLAAALRSRRTPGAES
jgi:hypothetical protein